MLWELEIWSKGHNPDRERVCSDYDLLTHSKSGHEVITAVSRGYLLDADLTTEVDRVRLTDLLTDPLVEDVRLAHLNAETHDRPVSAATRCVTVLPKPGVMDPVAASVMAAARDALIAVRAVRTFRRYQIQAAALDSERDLLTRKVLANDAIEQVSEGPLPAN